MCWERANGEEPIEEDGYWDAKGVGGAREKERADIVGIRGLSGGQCHWKGQNFLRIGGDG